jgi:hypothetical protein
VSGTLVAATLWERGGRTSIVVLDAATGDERARFSPRARTAPRVGKGPRLTVVANPAWIGDSMVVFTSDHDGASAIYRGDARTGAYGPLWTSATSLQTPDVSPDGARIAAVELRGEGFRVVERALPSAPPMQTWLEDAEPLPALEQPMLHAAPDRQYTARTSVGPTWWLPASSSSDLNELGVGFLTGGRDVVGRHEWRLSLLRDLDRPETSGSFAYTYAGFGNPLVELSWQRAWQHAGLFDMSNQLVGFLAERNDALTASVVLTRPRVRLTSYAVGAAQVELLEYRTYPSPYLAQLEANGFNPRERVPALIGAFGFSTMQRPALSVSAQDGIAARLTGIFRPDDAVDGGDSHELRVSASAAKSLALPGFARHVVALRGAAGVANDGATRDFDVGGVSGASVELIPGFAFGGVYRDFFVRGVPAGAQRGLRAASASAEYRAPLKRVGRGYRFVPAGLMTMSAVLFADAGAAWCAAAVAGSPVCEGPIAAREVLASAGAELHFDATLQYDTSYRFRLGIARAVRGDAFTNRGPTIYFTLGETF